SRPPLSPLFPYTTLFRSGRSMDILLLGSGGREDALAWRLRQSPSCGKLIAAPGNPGIARWADCVGVDPCNADAVVKLARGHGVRSEEHTSELQSPCNLVC